jgi:hypothetical protein
MKKPKAERRRIRAKKYEKKVAVSGTFSNMLEALDNANRVHKLKTDKKKAG